MKKLSSLLENIPPSATVAVVNRAKALQAAGEDVIILAGGDPDFDTPVHIQDAAIAAIRAGDTHYPAPSKGTKPCVEAIAKKFEEDTGVVVNPSTQIIATPSGKWALNLALGAILNPGDEVLYFEPVWVSYPPLIRLNGGVPVDVPLRAKDGWRISADLIRQKITSRTKAIMVTNPNNPTGRVLTQAEIDAVVEVAIEHDLYVISDEIYEKLIFDGRKHISIAGEAGMAERTLVINGVSKSYAMTGWRLGWLVAAESIIKLAGVLHSQTVTAATSFGMVAIEAALNGPDETTAMMRDSYQARRDFMVAALNEIDGIECASIEGAFYLFPRFTKTRKNSIEIAEYLLENAKVAATPGSAFGAAGEGHLRLAISTAMSDLERAAERLARVVPTME